MPTGWSIFKSAPSTLEMTRAGLIEEMVNESLDSAMDAEDMEEETEEEINKVLAELANDTRAALPFAKVYFGTRHLFIDQAKPLSYTLALIISSLADRVTEREGASGGEVCSERGGRRRADGQ